MEVMERKSDQSSNLQVWRRVGKFDFSTDHMQGSAVNLPKVAMHNNAGSVFAFSMPKRKGAPTYIPCGVRLSFRELWNPIVLSISHDN